MNILFIRSFVFYWVPVTLRLLSIVRWNSQQGAVSFVSKSDTSQTMNASEWQSSKGWMSRTHVCGSAIRGHRSETTGDFPKDLSRLLSQQFFLAWIYHTWNKSLLTLHRRPPPHRREMGKTGTRRRTEDVLEGRRKWDCGCLWFCICRYRTRSVNLTFTNIRATYLR